MHTLPSRLALGAGLAAILAAFIDAGCDRSVNPTLAGSAGVDASGPKIPVEASAVDVGVPDAEALPDACELPVIQFTPSSKPPATLYAGKCTDAQIEALVSCNFDTNADAGACMAVLQDAANKDCNNCLFVTSTAKALGPVVITGSVGTLNVAGCLAQLTNDASATGCGARFQASEDCADETCSGIPCGDPRLDDPESCRVWAKSTVCAAYANAAVCADQLLAPGGAAEACSDGPDKITATIRVGRLFCAGGDAGAALDGATDG